VREEKGDLVQNLGHFEGFRAGAGGGGAQAQGRRSRRSELMCPKKGLFFAILGLFLQTKGGVEEQKVGRCK
jgi:hypothetical protein